MPDRQGARTLPPEALAGLHQAFRAEVAERLPRLQALHAGSCPRELAEARRAAHSLAGSAVVLGEPGASRAARDIESSLSAGAQQDVPAQVDVLVRLLGAWR